MSNIFYAELLEGSEEDVAAFRELLVLYEALVLNWGFSGSVMPKEEKLAYAGPKLVKRCFDIINTIPALFGSGVKEEKENNDKEKVPGLEEIIGSPADLEAMTLQSILSTVLTCARLQDESAEILADGFMGGLLDSLLPELVKEQTRPIVQQFVCTAIADLVAKLPDKKMSIAKAVCSRCRDSPSVDVTNDVECTKQFYPLVYTFAYKKILPKELVSELVRDVIRSLQGIRCGPEALSDSLNLLYILVMSYPDTLLEELGTKDGKARIQGLVEVLFDRCLFYVPEKDAPLAECLTFSGRRAEQTRLCGFNILSLLSRITPELFRLVANRIHERLDRMNFRGDSSWNLYNVNSLTTARNGLVGLQNQGSTCYMNSVLQQLFRVDELREAVLSADSPQTDPDPEFGGVQPTDVDYNFVRKLQLLFATMDLGLVKAAETRPFCNSVRNEEFDVFQQMDAYEFLVFLFDRIDTNFEKISPRAARRMKEAFHWELATNIVCTPSGHLNTRREDSYALSLDIHGKKDVHQSIRSLVQSEKMYGENQFHCDFCGKPVDATKKLTFKHLPRILVIHLKRFEYSIKLGTNIKLNDYYEFPMVLDMEEYMDTTVTPSSSSTQQTSAVSSFSLPPPHGNEKYRLVGAVLHVGTSESGHYVSIAKVKKNDKDGMEEKKEGKEEDNSNDDNGQWFMFNDSSVTPFDVQKIPEYCFGVKQNQSTPSSDDMSSKFTAYLLFYEKIQSNDDDDEIEESMVDDDDDDGDVTDNSTDGTSVKVEESDDDDDDGKDELKKVKKGGNDDESSTEEEERMEDDEGSESVHATKKETKRACAKPPETSVDYKKTTQWVIDKVREEYVPNVRYINIANPGLITFIWNISHIYTHNSSAASEWLVEDFDPCLHSFKLLLRVAVDITLRFSNIKEYFHVIIADLKKTVTNSKKTARWLLQALTLGKYGFAQKILVDCPFEQDKIELIDLIMTAFTRVSDDEKELYMTYDDFYERASGKDSQFEISEEMLFKETPQQTDDGDGRPACVPFIDSLLSMVHNFCQLLYVDYLFIYLFLL